MRARVKGECTVGAVTFEQARERLGEIAAVIQMMHSLQLAQLPF